MAKKYTEDQLNTLDKSFLVQMYLNLQEQLESLTKETHELNEKMQLMMEQLILNKHARFGRSSEKMTDAGQICFKEVDGNILFFNEAEAISNMAIPELEDLEVKPTRGVKPAGRKEGHISGLPVNRIDHYLSAGQLTLEFGEEGWKQLPDAVMKHYRFVPAKVEVDEHHIGVYASKKDNRVVKAPHPSSLLRGSLVSASLGAAIMNAKYVNGIPLHRMEKEFERYGLTIDRRNMANWMIRLAEEYLGVLYDRLHEKLYDFHVIQADETPVLVKRDGRDAGAKSYMWVYRSGFMNKEQQIILYDYQKTRSGEHPRKFIKDYKGICVTDGYQVYHTVEKRMDDLTIAGCWVHCRRGFDDAMQTIAKEHQKESISYLIMKQIQAIYREEGKLKDLSARERRMQRQVVVKPLVDALFAYLKQNEPLIERKGTLRAAFTYALNQEKYLRVFLSDGEVPIDNNASERAIRGFCIGRKNWQMIDTINGAKSSAIIYSIAETAKANYLKPYDYFEYLLTEIPKHMADQNRLFIEELLPWSPKLPESIRKPVK
ncbi:IS66 family transposase [Enterocloster citroniae]|uniref:IS66 family transposase n=2 Tax=Enterocloster citroniae TaxID=358743 RepID=UPI0008F26F91|nr:IS66 family transposase [Enterocloster citroniae]SFR95470.1 Transposase [Enterocloster citroniae]